MVLGGNATLIPAETRDWLRLWISSFTFLTTLTRPRDHESVVAETGGKSCDSMSAKLPDPSFSKNQGQRARIRDLLEFLPWSCDIKYSFKESDNICVTSLTALWTAIRSICRCKITFNDSSIISPSTSVTISSRCSFSWNRTHFYEFSKKSFFKKTVQWSNCMKEDGPSHQATSTTLKINRIFAPMFFIWFIQTGADFWIISTTSWSKNRHNIGWNEWNKKHGSKNSGHLERWKYLYLRWVHDSRPARPKSFFFENHSSLSNIPGTSSLVGVVRVLSPFSPLFGVDFPPFLLIIGTFWF